MQQGETFAAIRGNPMGEHMFRGLGIAVSRFWPAVLVAWLACCVALQFVLPAHGPPARDGEFAFLPDESPSRRSEALFRSAFSKDFLGSNVLIVVRRTSRDEGLLPSDRAFIEDVLKPRLVRIARESGGLAPEDGPDDSAAATTAGGLPSVGDDSSAVPSRPVVSAVRTYSDREIGHLLDSEDHRASLVLVNLTTEFHSLANRALLSRIEELIDLRRGELRQQRLIPPGIDLSISGSATVGRDLHDAETDGARRTETLTVLFVLALLVAIYRSPLLAAIPLVAVFVAVRVAVASLKMLADAGLVIPFSSLDLYVIVATYGSGVGWCMFLIARYKEELDRGLARDEAIAAALARVGGPIAAAAAAAAAGMGTMAFAAFGKLQQAGIALSLATGVAVAASLTLAPALLMLLRKWAFWPYLRDERVAQAIGWFSPTSLVNRLLESDAVASVWDRFGQALLRRPATFALAAAAALAPFAAVAIGCRDALSFGLLSELPDDKPSAIGARALQDHFSPGETGPVTVLLSNPRLDFSNHRERAAVGELTRRLVAAKEELGLADVRSVTEPLGVTVAARRADERFESELKGLSFATQSERRIAREKKVREHYIADRGENANRVTRIDVVFPDDPFSRESVRHFQSFARDLPGLIPEPLREGTEIAYFGATASIRDLSVVTGSDRLRLFVLATCGVYGVLALALRRFALAAWLVAGLVLASLAALGAAFLAFRVWDPSFAGLDWKVPIFSIAILVGCGAGGSIQLIFRIREEKRHCGPVLGIATALARTGGILSSAGLAGAGAFSAAMAGALVGMDQLGFALALGALLATFVVRPILVPAFLVMLETGRFGPLGPILGADASFPEQKGSSERENDEPADATGRVAAGGAPRGRG